jgi:hypothetical protein
MKITTFERQKSCFDIVYAQQRAQLHLLINYIDVQRERESCGKCFCISNSHSNMKRNACSKIVTLELLLDTHAVAVADARGVRCVAESRFVYL